ncbi:MAG: glutamate synthase [Acidiferrobacteraceae bacterium]|jgi:NADPH-dependent glutamate synthase beta subunit-like oxidoreductase/Pyruvate/2-oxoacid:ferredoxin oxidoreductase delta subunit|nr:glutamate synthase [Acidiferrobacteraceae bacterium]MDP6434717.1 NAD(P)-binding protein [Arenicellales bacterium]MDP6671440.1 NAD(P)-binding protein [Arenicellales bacterium]MDP6724348.1 NAD(P)-binding protein [Arenicellales bacterium]|tara:strand:- start:25081 stop:27039 length:1959 start_codon:yes stop_codon:yes gene_type:complete
MSTSTEDVKQGLTFRSFEEGDDHNYSDFQQAIFKAGHSHKCPVYVQRTPPCQESCPSGEDIRGWLQIVRGTEKPTGDKSWEEFAFLRSTEANPFPAIMGRVCPAPCENGCNRNKVDDVVGINAIEQFIGDTAFREGFDFAPPPALTGKRIAIIGGGPAGLSAAYQLRRKGHASTLFEAHDQLGGMIRFGIPGHRTPRDILDCEINRIINLGDIEVKTAVRIGTDVSIDTLEREYDAVLWAIGCQRGYGLPVPDWEGTPNCVNGIGFLEAYNKGDLKVTADKVVCVGGGDTSIDVVSVARRLGKISNISEEDRVERVMGGHAVHDSTLTAAREGVEVTLTALFPKEEMTAAEYEVDDACEEGVTILNGVMPIGLVKDDSGRATALRMAKCTVDAKGIPTAIDDTEFEIEADLIVSAIGQGGDFTGIEEMKNDRHLIDADKFYQVPSKPGHFVAGDVVRPHLLTSAIGQGSIAADTIDHFLNAEEQKKRPKVDVHHFDLLNKLKESGLEPVEYDHTPTWGTSDLGFAVHNFEDRSSQEVISSNQLFLGHFKGEKRHHRKTQVPTADEVLGHFEERHIGLPVVEVQEEAKRCMSCGMCFECDNCVVFCPQDAVFRVKKDSSTTGRYVDTDYSRCIGCHICADVCPTGYIDMGMGE